MRGDVYRLTAPRSARGHEQRGSRYAVVLQSDRVPLSTWLVSPTSTNARPTSFRPQIHLDGGTQVLVEQTTAVDPERLGDYAGRLTADELSAVDEALRTILEQ